MGKGFIFKCTDRSEPECLSRSLFGTDKLAGDEVLALQPGDKLFLLNVESDRLMGVFEAKSEGGRGLVPEAWKGRYLYQVEMHPRGPLLVFDNAKKTLSALGLASHQLLSDFEVDALATVLTSNQGHGRADWEASSMAAVLKQEAEKLTSTRKANGTERLQDDRPILESTTLWDFPKQSYGRTPKGDNKYAGRLHQ